MTELRWALVALGVVFLAGLGLWEWRRSGRKPVGSTRIDHPSIEEMRDSVQRIEPRFDDLPVQPGADPDDSLELPTIHPVEPVLVSVMAESAVDIPSAARRSGTDSIPVVRAPTVEPLIQWPPRKAERVLSLRIANVQGTPLAGRDVRIALEAAGLRHGPQTIYHLVNPDGTVVASVANLVQPGNLVPAVMDTQQFKGLSLFSVLPGPLPAVRMLEELVGLARGLAHRLAATVQDEQGAELDAAQLIKLRQSLPVDDRDEDGAA